MRGGRGGRGEKRHAGPGLHENTHSSPWPGTLHLGTIVIRTSKFFSLHISHYLFSSSTIFVYEKSDFRETLYIRCVFIQLSSVFKDNDCIV